MGVEDLMSKTKTPAQVELLAPVGNGCTGSGDLQLVLMPFIWAGKYSALHERIQFTEEGLRE